MGLDCEFCKKKIIDRLCHCHLCQRYLCEKCGFEEKRYNKNFRKKGICYGCYRSLKLVKKLFQNDLF